MNLAFQRQFQIHRYRYEVFHFIVINMLLPTMLERYKTTSSTPVLGGLPARAIAVLVPASTIRAETSIARQGCTTIAVATMTRS
jgi:hypothetical protein